MTLTSSSTTCFICDQENCPNLRTHAHLQLEESHESLSSQPEFRDSSLVEYNEYFYTTCHRCDQPAARGVPERPLCLNCQHLRLQHFFLCTRDDNPRGLKLLLGTYRQIREGYQEACEFCTLVYNAVQILCVATSYLINKGLQDDTNAYLYRKAKASDRMCIMWKAGWVYNRVFEIPLGFALSPSGPWIWDKMTGENQSQGLNMRAAGSQISWVDVKKWLSECDLQHDPGTHNSTKSSAHQPQELMVIDVEAGCIVDAPPDCSYIALSYVWGTSRVGELSAEAATISTLRAPRSLKRDTLPATIWDAMTVCQELGVQYLWVDRLCIIQDCDTQKTEQIRSMDVIYSQATLTICAVGSIDSHTGLWGTSGTPRSLIQGHARIGGVEIMQMLYDDRDWRLGHTWWKRAWTYQEYILSRRKLLFSPWQVTFECDHGVGVEGFTNVVLSTPEAELLDSQKPRLLKYKDIVQEYNGRDFSYLDDLYVAFQGVFKLLYGSLDQYVWGLPAADFDRALLWYTESPPIEYYEGNPRGTGNPRQTKRGVHLASWSWVHRSGRTNLDCNFHVFASVARWFVWDDVRGLQPVVSDGLEWKDHYDPTIHAWTAWFSGCIESPLPAELDISIGLLPLRDRLPQIWPKYQDYWREAFATPATWITPEDVALVKAKTGRILLRTTLASLPVKAINLTSRYCGYQIRDLDDRLLGKIFSYTLDPSFVSNDPGEQWDFVALTVGVESPTVEEFKENSLSGQACDFRPLPQHEKSVCEPVFGIPLVSSANRTSSSIDAYASFQRYCSQGGVDASSILSSDWTIHDDEGYAVYPPTVINVMMISWHEGVARRLGLGWVWLAQWMKAKPVFRTIVLE